MKANNILLKATPTWNATPTLKCKKLSDKAKVPIRAKEGDAGSDLFAAEEMVIPCRGSALVKTNLAVEIPFGCVGLVWSRSGLSVKSKIEVGAGCIDAGYRGDVGVHLYNNSFNAFKIMPGDKIAQLLVLPVCLSNFEAADELSDTDRGEGGFGSTGK